MTINLPQGTKVPHHLAVIPDGNRRWAESRHLPAFVGHRQGFKRLRELRKTAQRWGIHTVTIWAFSTENWQREKEEVSYLMDLYQSAINDYLKDAQKERVRIIHLGRKDRIPEALRAKLEDAQKETEENNKHVLNIALDYGGRDEIVRAIKRKTNQDPEGEVTEENFENYLDTVGQPYPCPDFLIRTSGEIRTSGFLPWQTAYTEFYFTEKHLPDFKVEDLKEAILDFSKRERRFGK